MLTEQSVGRIVDADFATETSELSKQQILAQAATSMLAQANQSKQSVLALLQIRMSYFKKKASELGAFFIEANNDAKTEFFHFFSKYFVCVVLNLKMNL